MAPGAINNNNEELLKAYTETTRTEMKSSERLEMKWPVGEDLDLVAERLPVSP